MDWRSRITFEPGKRGGKPCIRGLRITVTEVLEYLASGMSEDEILRDFPDLTREDLRACLPRLPCVSDCTGTWATYPFSDTASTLSPRYALLVVTLKTLQVRENLREWSVATPARYGVVRVGW